MGDPLQQRRVTFPIHMRAGRSDGGESRFQQESGATRQHIQEPGMDARSVRQVQGHTISSGAQPQSNCVLPTTSHTWVHYNS